MKEEASSADRTEESEKRGEFLAIGGAQDPPTKSAILRRPITPVERGIFEIISRRNKPRLCDSCGTVRALYHLRQFANSTPILSFTADREHHRKGSPREAQDSARCVRAFIRGGKSRAEAERRDRCKRIRRRALRLRTSEDRRELRRRRKTSKLNERTNCPLGNRHCLPALNPSVKNNSSHRRRSTLRRPA